MMKVTLIFRQGSFSNVSG